MSSQVDNQYQYQSDTQSIISSQFDQLNYARIYDTPIMQFLSPSMKKIINRKKQQEQFSDQENFDWRTQLTKSINQQIVKTQSPLKFTQIKDKYPSQILNQKAFTITVKVKNKNTQVKYQNLCSICLDFHTNQQGLLNCGHKFCLDCISEWIKTSTNCPCCRSKFDKFVKITLNNKNIEKKRQIIKVQPKQMTFNQLDYYVCLQCNRGDDQDVLLICDSCDFYCVHIYCDRSLNNIFPEGEWYCKFCKEKFNESQRIYQESLQRQNQAEKITTQSIQLARTQTIRKSSPLSVDQQNELQNQSTQQTEGKNMKKSYIQHSKARQIFSAPKRRSTRLQSNLQQITNTNNHSRNLRNIRRRQLNNRNY